MSELQRDTLIDDRYRVIEWIGSGGMADVYCVRDEQLGRRVALKLLHRRFASDEEFVERFRREASSAAGLQHPHVVSVYDRGEWDGTYYIAMEYLEGRSLKQVIRETGPLDPTWAIDVAIQVLRAARFAHKRGVIHRDLKPHNVIVDPEGRAKVTDFGIARAGASDMTETGSIMGTAQYLSPEQAQGRAVSAQSDLYSVGIILYEMLTGRIPFEADSAVSIALKQVSEEPVPPSVYNAAVTPELEAVVLRAMEKDPADRFTDAEAFIAALEAVRDGTAPPVRTPPARGDAAPTRVVAAGAPLVHEVERSEEVPPAEPRRRRVWPWVLALLALALIGVGLFLALSPDREAVPDVVGRSESAAVAILDNAGFDPRIEDVRNPRIPEGRVVKQSPGAGAEAEVGSTVIVFVSSGPGTAAVPPVEGLTRRSAERRLRDAGFRVRTREQASDDVPRGRVIQATPPQGTVIERGSRVVLVVSTGPDRVEVPDVTGRPEDEARRILGEAGFDVASREQETADEAPGTVLSQDPGAGEQAKKGAQVTITVAAKPSTVQVPDVVGRSAEEASDTLAEAGFRPVVRNREVQTPDEDGVVVEQSPRGGEERAEGARVIIRVGRFEPDLDPDPGPEPTPSPTPTPTPE